MKIDRISPSSYSSWDGCPHAFFLEQNLKYRYPPHIKADMGTVVHKALEILALIKLRDQEDPTNKMLKIGDNYTLDTSSYTLDEITAHALTLYKEDFFDKAQISQIKKFINTAISSRNGQYDPRNREIVAPEKRVKLDFPESWAKNPDGTTFYLSAVMDLVTKNDENTYEIIDWKCKKPSDFVTGKKIDYKAAADLIQLRAYHWAATKLFGEDKNYLLSIYYLETDDVFTIPYDNDDLQKTEYLLRDRYEEIRSCEYPKLNRSFKCTRFCPFGKNTCEGTNLPNMIQDSFGGIARAGQPMTICDASNYAIHMYGIDFVQENFGKYSKENKE